MAAYGQSEKDHPFVTLFEAVPDSHPASTSPFFVRTIESTIGNTIEDSFSSSNPLNGWTIYKRDASLDTSIVGIVIPFCLQVIQIGFQAKGNHIATASLQLAQAVARSGQAHRVADAVGAGGMTAAGVLSSAASGVALVGADTVVHGVSALQQRAGGAYRWALSFPSLSDNLAALNPFNRSRSAQTDPQDADGVEQPLPGRDVRRLPNGTLELFRNLGDGNTESITIVDENLFPDMSNWAHDDLVRRVTDFVDGEYIFIIGPDYSEDDVDTLDGMQIEENPWAGETGVQVMDDT